MRQSSRYYYDDEQTSRRCDTRPRRKPPKGSDRSRDLGLRFQPDAVASSLYFASVSCTPADRKAAAALSLGEHAIQARDFGNFSNPLDRPQPYFAAAGLPVIEDICSRIASLPVAALEGGPQ
jgi:hypothetical protein